MIENTDAANLVGLVRRKGAIKHNGNHGFSKQDVLQVINCQIQEGHLVTKSSYISEVLKESGKIDPDCRANAIGDFLGKKGLKLPVVSSGVYSLDKQIVEAAMKQFCGGAL